MHGVWRRQVGVGKSAVCRGLQERTIAHVRAQAKGIWEASSGMGRQRRSRHLPSRHAGLGGWKMDLKWV